MKKKKFPENNKKQIVFFCATTPYVMIYKIAKEFKKRGYETVLITISQRDKWDINWYKDGFDKIICSNFQFFKPTIKNSFNMLKRTPFLLKSIYEMKKLKPYVVFAVARPNYITALAMKFFKKYPVIYFPYDINSHFHEEFREALKKGVKLYEINAERYCFENAEGILHKGDPGELEFLNKKSMLGEPVKMTPLQICFHPYCSDEFMAQINKNKLSKKDKRLHIVYVGGLSSGEKDLNSYKILFQKIINQKIHLHFYVKTQHLSNKESIGNLSPLIKYFFKNKYFHLEEPVPAKELASEISKYDFGIWVDHYLESSMEETSLYPNLTTGNKISSFFEAGIPFIFPNSFRFVGNLTKKYQLNFEKEIDDFDSLNDDLKKLNYKKIEKKVIKARKDFNNNNHFLELEEFVKKVIAEKSKRNLLPNHI